MANVALWLCCLSGPGMIIQINVKYEFSVGVSTLTGILMPWL